LPSVKIDPRNWGKRYWDEVGLEGLVQALEQLKEQAKQPDNVRIDLREIEPLYDTMSVPNDLQDRDEGIQGHFIISLSELHQYLREDREEYERTGVPWSGCYPANEFHELLVAAAVRLLNHHSSDDFEKWLESLPFPLASVLWRYHADIEPSRKNTDLFFFFEALAEFNATIMLSALYTDQELFRANRGEWFYNKNDFEPLSRSTIGEWITIGERLSRFTRQMLSDDRNDLCLRLYGLKTSNLIEPLVGKDLYAILRVVNQHRNDWKGHTGNASEEVEMRRLETLEAQLTSVREKGILDPFARWMLVAPGPTEITEGDTDQELVYKHTVDNLHGRDAIFRKMQVESLCPMKKGRTYLLDAETRRPLELLPFFRIRPSPETKEVACYFYNRIDKGVVRWVSYHFKGDDIVEPDKHVEKVLGDLRT